MDAHTQTAVLASVLAAALAMSVLLRSRKERVHWLFGLLGWSVSGWYLSTFMTRIVDHPSAHDTWTKINLVCALCVPIAAFWFFREFTGRAFLRVQRIQWAVIASGLALGLCVFTDVASHRWFPVLVFLYVAGTLTLSMVVLLLHRRTLKSKSERARLRYLALVGALAAGFTLLDYLSYVGLDAPAVGTVLTLTFLYALSQSMVRARLIDLYELAGKLSVLTVLSFLLAGIFWALVLLAKNRFFVHSVAAALVVLLLFEPLRAKVEQRIAQLFFRERYSLEQTVVALRPTLTRVFDVRTMAHAVLEGLESSKRVTHAAIYLLDPTMIGYTLVAHIGPSPVPRIDAAAARPLFDRLLASPYVLREQVESELDETQEREEIREVETLSEVLQALQATHATVCMALKTEREVFGLLCIMDDRMRDAFSPEELQLLQSLAAQATTVVENSRLYRRLQERDRLMALGEMAAGLAHEIRNPLGTIKGSAQYLAELLTSTSAGSDKHHEFLDIIVEETDRLNRVVSSFLDFAKPAAGNPTLTDVNAAVRRSLQLLLPTLHAAHIVPRLDLRDGLPAVRIDVEQLRQVLINITQNAMQAMPSGGELRIETSYRPRGGGGRASATAEAETDDDASVATRLDEGWVQIRMTDTGPGIADAVAETIFLPFVTTRESGTGLGLAISQRIIMAAGGHMEAHNAPQGGATLLVQLPAAQSIERIERIEGIAHSIERN
jgi:two-component system sensor histidine kinase HydH